MRHPLSASTEARHPLHSNSKAKETSPPARSKSKSSSRGASNQATEAVAQLSRYQRREVAADGKGFVTIDPEQLRWALGGLHERIDPEGRWDPDEARRVADGAALAVFAESVLENFFDSAAYGLGNLDLTDAVDEDFTFVLEALAEAGAEGSLHYDEGGAMGPLWFLLEAGELGFLPADLEHEDV